MLRLIGIVISIGLADSLNPTTLAPGLFLATGAHARRTLAEFTAGVFTVYFLGGLLIALGPGELVLTLVPKPDLVVRHVLEVCAGAVLLAVAALLLMHRGRLSQRQLPNVSSQRPASWLMGATIMAIELPTAFPYFAALAAIEGSGIGLVRKVCLILLFNVCFVTPLIVIQLILWIAGDAADVRLARASAFLQRRWPVILAAVAIAAGLVTIGLGATGTYQAARRLLHKAVIFHHRL